MSIKVLYFASLAQTLGTDEETLTLPEDITTLGQLQQHLAARGGVWQAVNGELIRMASNQALAKANEAVQDGDEVAFFPPVTGG